MKHYFINFWNQKRGRRRAADHLVFLFLIFCEVFYRIVFLIQQKVASLKPQHHLTSKVIAVGNLSVGGTGKTVFVHFLSTLLNDRSRAIIMRGYGGQISSSGKHCVINIPGSSFSVVETGDEAFMLSKKINVPIAIGKDRMASYELLRKQGLTPAVVILDDAYQNRRIHKDYVVLLIDARKPFENGHCLPAGPLREKDYTRANCIILTHADHIPPSRLETLKEHLFPQFDHQLIFAGKHTTAHITDLQGNFIDKNSIKYHTFCCFAGIGSFSGFVQTVRENGLCVVATKEFADHHVYTNRDIENIIQHAQNQGCSALITTEKDWVKIAPLISNSYPIYILAVTFEFLSSHEYSFFIADLHCHIATL